MQGCGLSGCSGFTQSEKTLLRRGLGRDGARPPASRETDCRTFGQRVPESRSIGDGDLSAGIAAEVIELEYTAVMGSRGAPEGVITAAAIRC